MNSLKVTYNPFSDFFNQTGNKLASYGMEKRQICGISNKGIGDDQKFYAFNNYSHLDTDRMNPERHTFGYLVSTPMDEEFLNKNRQKYLSFIFSEDDIQFNTFQSDFCDFFNISIIGKDKESESSYGISTKKSIDDIEFLFTIDRYTKNINIYDNGEINNKRKYIVYSILLKEKSQSMISDQVLNQIYNYGIEFNINNEEDLKKIIQWKLQPLENNQNILKSALVFYQNVEFKLDRNDGKWILKFN